MIRKLMTSLGATKSSLIITAVATLLSAALYEILSRLVFSKFEGEGLVIAAIIPAVIAPPLSYLVFRMLSQIDLTERALRVSIERYRSILASIEELYFEVDLAGNLKFFNDAVCRLSGYSEDELLGMNNRVYADQETARRMYEVFSQVYRTGDPVLFTNYQITVKSGWKKTLELSTSLIRDPSGRPVGFRGIGRDVTERKLAESALRESEEKYRQLLDHAPTGIYEIDFSTGRFLSVNDVMCEYTGYTKEEFLALSPFDLLADESKEEFAKRVQMALAGEKPPENVEFKVSGKGGREFWVILNSRFSYKDGKPVRATAVVHDISERKRAEQAIQQSEERYRSLVENTLDGYFICRYPSGEFLFLNRRICKLYDYSMQDALGLSLWDVFDPGDHEQIRTRLEPKTEGRPLDSHRGIFTAVRKDGSIFRAEVSTSFVTFGGEPALQGVLRDITEHEALQKQLQQAQRMEAIGTLAGGFAHDFNNLLMGIWGNISLIRMETDEGHPHYERLTSIESFIKSGADLTRQLLGFARGGKYEVKPTNLNRIMEKTATMFGRSKKEIRIHTNYRKDLWPVEVDQTQIEQVLLNLYVNAWQAMPDGGDLYLSTENVVLPAGSESLSDVKPGRYAKMSVTDTGIGMDEGTQKKIFDPFFTTKELERGTGLGLASAYGIIQNHNGMITVRSRPGAGATLEILLPASDKVPAEDKEAAGAFARGSEGILLVDDEEEILHVTRQLLEALDYRVFVARDGKTALEMYQANRDRIHMVVLDMIMPDMGGGKTYEELKKLAPRVKVLLCSGYSEDSQAKEILSQGCNGFIQKPFNLTELSQRVRSILDTPS